VHDSGSGLPTRPEIDKLSGVKLACIYGDEEKKSLCPSLDAKKTNLIKLPGGHHFKGDYERVAQAVLDSVGH
jgi:type IV secretory pathway VirJ component